jgi:hypothetical protein
MFFAMLVAIVMALRYRLLRPYAVWLLVGYLWNYYGTTVPYDWVPLARDPRYTLYLTIPASILIAASLKYLPDRLRTYTVFAVVAISILMPSMEQGSSALEPYRQLIQGKYVSNSTMGCYDYIVSRWVTGFKTPVDFSYSTELGCGSRQRQIAQLHSAQEKRVDEAEYVIVSQERDPKRIRDLEETGWRVVEHYPGRPSSIRELIARLLMHIPGQQERAKNILSPSGLTVMEYPEKDL